MKKLEYFTGHYKHDMTAPKRQILNGCGTETILNEIVNRNYIK